MGSGGRGDRAAPLPDFLVIGAIKCGTTTLFNWLAQHPGVSVAAMKEPHFFSRDDQWERGVEWYSALFSTTRSDTITGEASASYTAFSRAEIAAERAAQVVPNARLVYLIREPIERMRSHYRHAVLRDHEARSFGEAVRDPAARYVTSSLYYSCLAPYLERFGREQVLVVRMEDLVGDGEPGWRAVLDHLGLSHQPPPGTVHNRTSGKRPPRAIGRALFGRGLGAAPKWTPAWVRSAGRRVLLRNIDDDPRLRSADDPVPDDVRARVYADVERLTQVLDLPDLWVDARH
jgi:hypothetical protein